MAIRFALISGVYRKNLNFTDQGLEDAKTNIDRFRRADTAVEEALENGQSGEDILGAELENLYDMALEAMLSDLNTPIAISKALEGARLITRDPLTVESAKSGSIFLDRINELLGIVRHPEPLIAIQDQAESTVDDAYVVERIEARKAAKAAKNWGLADEIRKELADQGILLTDNPDGTTSWSQA